MTELKLAKLPERTPVKIAITVSPDLNRSLHAYAELYRKAYGASESVPELIPYMLQSFLDSDRGFARARKEGALIDSPASPAPLRRSRRRQAPESSSIVTKGE